MINGNHRITRIDDYAEFVGEDVVQRVHEKAKKVANLHVSRYATKN